MVGNEYQVRLIDGCVIIKKEEEEERLLILNEIDGSKLSESKFLNVDEVVKLNVRMIFFCAYKERG